MNNQRSYELEPTVGAYLSFLSPAIWKQRHSRQGGLLWPPDTFALAASLLRESGAYTHVTRPDGVRAASWADEVEKVGDEWREGLPKGPVPAKVAHWWRTLVAKEKTHLLDIRKNGDLCETLLKLLAASDVASAGAGLPSPGERSYLEREALTTILLSNRQGYGATLCKQVHPFKARVLPKLHTPISGLTIRSFSHNLALCRSVNVIPRWYLEPRDPVEASLGRLTILVIPWPLSVTPSEFTACEGRQAQAGTTRAGFFAYVPSRRGVREFERLLKGVLRQARKEVGPVDGVVLPELALTPSEYKIASRVAAENNSWLVTGRNYPSCEGQGRNEVAVAFPVTSEYSVAYRQGKHHRWRIDRPQIRQYALGGRLHPGKDWWENIELGQREIAFSATRQGLAFCVLICEDLARQEPVAEIVRAVGPSFVIALLMDGPQLSSRWPARYATIFAEDPGCSVLTVTSLGMSHLSRAVGVPDRSRVVALWREARSSSSEEIEMEDGCQAVALSLTLDWKEEWTADGRTDNGAACYPALSGVHCISAKT